MLDQQAGLCAICTDPMVPGKKTHVDHCHKTGRIRGLLCHHCNVAIGLMRESTCLLYAAADYIRIC